MSTLCAYENYLRDRYVLGQSVHYAAGSSSPKPKSYDRDGNEYTWSDETGDYVRQVGGPGGGRTIRLSEVEKAEIDPVTKDDNSTPPKRKNIGINSFGRYAPTRRDVDDFLRLGKAALEGKSAAVAKGIKRYLQGAGVIDSGLGLTPLGQMLKEDRLRAAPYALINLVYNDPQIRWFYERYGDGGYHQFEDVYHDLVDVGYSKNVAKELVAGYKKFVADPAFDVFPVGRLVDKKTFQIESMAPFIKSEHAVYALYRFSDKFLDGYPGFRLSVLNQHPLSPFNVFQVDREGAKHLLHGAAAAYPGLINTSFTHDLEKISLLRENIGSGDVFRELTSKTETGKTDETTKEPEESGAQFDASGLGLPGKSDVALKPDVAENKDAAYFVRRDLEATPKSETEERVEEVDEVSEDPSSDSSHRDDDAALERKAKEALNKGEPLRKKATRLRSKAKDAALKGRKEEAAGLRKQADEIEAEARKYIDEATNAGVELKNRRAKASQETSYNPVENVDAVSNPVADQDEVETVWIKKSREADEDVAPYVGEISKKLKQEAAYYAKQGDVKKTEAVLKALKTFSEKWGLEFNQKFADARLRIASRGGVSEENAASERDMPIDPASRTTHPQDPRYYPIDEEQIRVANSITSHFAPPVGTETKKYRQLVDKAIEAGELRKKEVDARYHADIDKSVKRYAKKLADWLNKKWKIIGSYGSSYVVGSGNYSTRKHDQKHRRLDAHNKGYAEVEELFENISRIGVPNAQQPVPETEEPVEKPEVSNSFIPEQQPEPVAAPAQEPPAKPRPERWTPLKSKMNDDDRRVVENTRKRINYGLSELAWRLGNAKEKGDVQRVKQLVATAANHYLEQARRAFRSHGGTEALAAFDEALGGDGLTVGQLRDRVVDKFRKIAQMEANDLFKFAGERLDEFESFAEADREPIANKKIYLNSIRDKNGKWEDLDDKDNELAVEDGKPTTLFPDEHFGRRMGSERGLADAVRRALKSMTRKGEYRDSFENGAEYADPKYNIDTPTRMGSFLSHGYKDSLDGMPVSRDDYSEQRYQELLEKFPTDRESRKLNNLFNSNNREVNKLIKENEDEYKQSKNKSEVVQRVVDGIRDLLSGGRQNGSAEAPPSESLRNGTAGEVLETGGTDRPSDGGDGRNLASVITEEAKKSDIPESRVREELDAPRQSKTSAPQEEEKPDWLVALESQEDLKPVSKGKYNPHAKPYSWKAKFPETEDELREYWREHVDGGEDEEVSFGSDGERISVGEQSGDAPMTPDELRRFAQLRHGRELRKSLGLSEHFSEKELKELQEPGAKRGRGRPTKTPSEATTRVAREAQKPEVSQDQAQEKVAEAVRGNSNTRKPQTPSLQEPGGSNAANVQALSELKQQDAGAEPLGEDVVQDRIAEAAAGDTSKRKQNPQRSKKPQDDSLLGNKREDNISDEEARRRIAKDNRDDFISAFNSIPKKAPSYWLARKIVNEINNRLSFGGWFAKMSIRDMLKKLNEDLRFQEYHSVGPSRLDSSAKDLAARLGIERGASLDYFSDLITDLDRAWHQTNPENIGLPSITSYRNGTYISPISPQKKVKRTFNRSSKTFNPDSIKDDVQKALQIRDADRSYLSAESMESMMSIAKDVSDKYGIGGLKEFMRRIDVVPTARTRPQLLKELGEYLGEVSANRSRGTTIRKM